LLMQWVAEANAAPQAVAGAPGPVPSDVASAADTRRAAVLARLDTGSSTA